MIRRPRAIVFDSWAVLAYFEDEPAGDTVSDHIADARDRDIPLLMSAVNAGEVWHIVAREVSEPEADQAVESLCRMGVEFVAADWPLARLAGTFKAKHRMSYADCFAAALTKIPQGRTRDGRSGVQTSRRRDKDQVVVSERLDRVPRPGTTRKLRHGA